MNIEAIRDLGQQRFQEPFSVSDQQVAAQFRGAVNRRLPAEHHVDPATLNKRLLNLRRRGEDNGGLRRLERSYR